MPLMRLNTQNSSDFENECPEYFESRDSIKVWISNYHIYEKKSYKVEQSSKILFEARCKEAGCEFHIKARWNKTARYVIKVFVKHTCSSYRSHVAGAYAVSRISGLKANIETLKPKDVRNLMQCTEGANISYMQAYRTIKTCDRQHDELQRLSYGLIKPWLVWNGENNQGCHYAYEETPENNGEPSEFECCFFAPSLASHSVQNSLPVVVLDACHTKGSYKGMIMTASVIMGDGSAFIIAFAIVPTENFKYWSFFLRSLEKAYNLSSRVNLVILSDLEKGLAQAVRDILPSANHSFCVYHLEKNIKVIYRTTTNGLIWRAAKTLSTRDFESTLSQLGQEKGSQIERFLRSLPASSWASSHFPVPRFGHVTSNIAESVNSAILPERKQTPFYILTGICRRITASVIQARSRISGLADTDLPKPLQKTLRKLKELARSLRVIRCTNSSLFEVQESVNSVSYRIFNAESKHCSCKKHAEFGYPCEHIYAVIFAMNLCEKDFIIPQRFVGSLRRTYNVDMILWMIRG